MSKQKEYTGRLARLKTRSRKDYNKFIDACRRYIALKHEYERDEKFRENIDKMIFLHTSYQDVRQNMIFNEEFSDLECSPVNSEENTVNDLAELVIKILNGSNQD